MFALAPIMVILIAVAGTFLGEVEAQNRLISEAGDRHDSGDDLWGPQPVVGPVCHRGQRNCAALRDDTSVFAAAGCAQCGLGSGVEGS
jgi:hypothetical protein